MTIKRLVTGQPTLTQLAIFQRADVRFAGNKCGRYFGGLLTEADVAFLDEKAPVTQQAE